MKIHILSSTDRPGSNALKVSEYVKRVISKNCKVELFSLEDYPLQDVVGGKYGDEIESVNSFNSEFLDADGFLFVIPEYNGGFPGILKLFYDYLPFPRAFKRTPVSLIGEAAGAFGALRPVEQFAQLLKYRKAHLFPDSMYIQRVNDNFDPQNGLKSEKLQELFLIQLNDFTDFVRKLSED
jgi:NAD(P)H-dependent FMN reductase